MDISSSDIPLTKKSAKFVTTLARVLAPEDVRVGAFVAILDELVELPSFLWQQDGAFQPREEITRVRLLPTQENVPFKVKAVCLPLVLVRTPAGRHQTLDLRRITLLKLSRRFAERAWKGYAEP